MLKKKTTFYFQTEIVHVVRNLRARLRSLIYHCVTFQFSNTNRRTSGRQRVK